MKLYKKNNRFLWILSVIFPTVGMPAIYMHYLSNNILWLLFPFIMTYMIAPFIDIYIGEYAENLPDEMQSQIEHDPYYKILTFIAVPVHITVFFISSLYVGLMPLSITEIVLIASQTQ